MFVVSEECV